MLSKSNIDISDRRLAWVREIFVFLAFTAGAVFLRLPAFAKSVIDWDESVYLLMASELLNGALPYTTIFDHKPPGIYIIFALGQLAFGFSVLSIRIVACLAVSLSSYGLYRFGRDIFANLTLGWLAGLLYMIFSVKNGGLTSNTELFFTPFLILGFYWLAGVSGFSARAHGTRALRLVAIGLAFGLALQIKYSTVFELTAALGLFSIGVFYADRRHFFVPSITGSALILLGVVLPFMVVITWYGLAGHLEEYFFTNFIANLVYSSEAKISLPLLFQALRLQLETNFMLWCSAILAPFFVIFFRKVQPRSAIDIGALGVWLMFSFIAMIFQKRFWDYYFLQLLPPLCLITAYQVVNSLNIKRVMADKQKFYLFTLVVLLGLTFPLVDPLKNSLYAIRSESPWKPADTPVQIAAFLKERIDPNSYLFVVDYQPILYYMVEAKIPTRYVVPNVLTKNFYANVAGIDPLQELRDIMALWPEYIVIKDRPESVIIQSHDYNLAFYRTLAEYLAEHYRKEASIKKVAIYRLRH